MVSLTRWCGHNTSNDSTYLWYVYMIAIRLWLLRILEFSLVESVKGPTLGLHEDKFGVQPIPFAMDEISTWLPTWQTWTVLAVIARAFFKDNS